MNQFFSVGWSYWIAIVSVLGIVFCLWLMWTQRCWFESRTDVKDTGHEWDGIKELNSPFPRWWTVMYLGLIVIGVAIITLYPALGSYKGKLNWTSKEEVALAEKAHAARLEEVFKPFKGMSLDEIVKDPKAQKIGRQLFLNNCAPCHGSDARGAINFPNLTDKDWLFGGKPIDIMRSIQNGRNGIMVGWKSVLSKEQAGQVADYVRSLSGLKVENKANIPLGDAIFHRICVACHGADAHGNQLIGAPNLSDDTWLGSSSRATIIHTVLYGRSGEMPAWRNVFTPEQIKMLTAYVWSLSNKPSK